MCCELHNVVERSEKLGKKKLDTRDKKIVDDMKARAVHLAGHPKMKCGSVQISTVLRDGKFSFHKLTVRSGE